jgi:carbamoyl-phosphate synthase small subunit
VQRLATGAVEITSQNHNYAVDAAGSVPDAEVTHVNLNDGVIEGSAARRPGLQRAVPPRGGPGPHDARYLFGEFRAS